ncbi:MAG: SDR family NAD(P)-dependent oxidoreductase [Bacteroidota bacterium]
MTKKVYLITGGSSGIGLSIANLLVSESHSVISLSRSQEKIDRALKQMPHLKGKVDFISCDTSCVEDMEEIFKYLNKKYGVLHGLVNSAAVLNKGTIETISIDDWQSLLNVNLSGPYIVIKMLLPLLKKADGASIVNISSVAGLKPGTSIAYSVSKAGLDMLTRFLAGDLGPYKIRVNAVSPGLVKTNIHLDNEIFSDKSSYDNMIVKSAKRYPIGRIGTPEDISEMVGFLLSEKASWVTGSIITVDGGIMVENDLIPPK